MDVEKTMQFLLEQQARFDARQAQFVERQAQFEQRMAEIQNRMAEIQNRMAEIQNRMAEIQNIVQDVATAQINTNAILATLAEQHVELEQSHIAQSEAQRVTAQNLEALSENLKELSDAQNVTEQNLSALILTVDRHIANHS
jgi:chromosome segregation ATPase